VRKNRLDLLEKNSDLFIFVFSRLHRSLFTKRIKQTVKDDPVGQVSLDEHV